MENKTKNVCVVVLGDIGRSPRMQYHSLSLAEMGHNVDIIGYGETEPMDEVKKTPLLFYHYLMPCPQVSLKILNYILKTVWQTLNLFFLLLIARKPDIIIVQNPPAIPALVVCWILSSILRCKFIIDWHNYAHTRMALSLSKKNILVQVTKKIEMFIGRRANYNFCVTNAMKKDLLKNWNITATTLYDKPPIIFRAITIEEKHNLLCKLGKIYKNLICSDGSTLITEIKDNQVSLKPSRPGLLVSSTSWSDDEDFSVLFSALQDYETHILNGNQRRLPQLLCFITGKGNLKDYYCQKILKQNWKHVTVITPWLESSDYPLMLALADLGVCLHISSSGLDLPMKVVDMFGCGLPVCAYDYNCLDELVKHGENSYKFSSTGELSEQLQTWFQHFPNDEQQNQVEKQFKDELEIFQKLRWRENWNNIASSLFL